MVVGDGHDLPDNPIEYGCHVSNVVAGKPCPSYYKLEWRLAANPHFDGPVFGYPMAFFTTSLEINKKTGKPGLPESSIYPCKAPLNSVHWRCKLPMEQFNEGYEMFEVFKKRKRNSPPYARHTSADYRLKSSRHRTPPPPEGYQRWFGQDFLIFVKSHDADCFRNRPEFRSIPDFKHRLLARIDGVWYSNIYRGIKDRYCKVGVVGDIRLPMCVRASEKLLIKAARTVSTEIIQDLKKKLPPRAGWTNRSARYLATMVGDRIEFLRQNHCKSWSCKQSLESDEEKMEGDALQIVKDVARLIWMYSERLLQPDENNLESEFHRETFVPEMVRLAQSYANHGDCGPCDCPCDECDTVRKRAETRTVILEADGLVSTVVRKRCKIMRCP